MKTISLKRYIESLTHDIEQQKWGQECAKDAAAIAEILSDHTIDHIRQQSIAERPITPSSIIPPWL